MNRYWAPLVERLHPYVPGEQPKSAKLVKLNTNENPYGPSPAVLDAIRQATGDTLRLYPDPEALELRQSIAAYHGLDPDHVFTGNGSDEILALSFAAFFSGGRPLLYPDVSYSFYPVYCNLIGIDAIEVPLAADFSLSVSAFDQPNGGIIFPNPNAPTSLTVSLEQIETLLRRHPESVVVIDEAYVDFGADSAVSLLHRYENLLVIQTFSKSRSLAGLRVGFALGQPHLIEALIRVKDSFNSYPLDRLAQVGAIAAMQDIDYFEITCRKIIATRDESARALRELGYDVLASKTNFLFASHPRVSAEALSQVLRSRDILVRHWNHPRIDRHVRISIGTDDEMAALLDVLRTDQTLSG